jgi:hypothetical protein
VTDVVVAAFSGAIIASASQWFAEWLHFRYAAARERRARENA